MKSLVLFREIGLNALGNEESPGALNMDLFPYLTFHVAWK
jgi:hypothetical protein